MEIFGWIMLILLGCFGLGVLVVFAIPFVVTETKMLSYKIQRAIEDKKLDIEKRSEEKKHRDEIKREKDFELANKRLDAKLQKVDKKISIYNKKLELNQQLKKETTEELNELKAQREIANKEVKAKEVKKTVQSKEVQSKEVKKTVKEEQLDGIVDDMTNDFVDEASNV